ncbi:MAG TPA: glycine cleavage T C-terminal barrel domain-containing protein [Chthoniobacteraceae bacterium]|nr:glycine cleavage T C-terminal barrel domain-containing protein [Chthoniobacteraceae bacterium]
MSAEAYQHFRAHGGVFDLSRRTKLRLTGADRIRYLNGQVTANVTKLGAEAALPACVTTAKGKLSAEVCIAAGAGDSILVDADEVLRESLPARLERYIVADDVTLEDVTDTYALFHFLLPPSADEAFAAAMPQVPVATVRRAHRYGRPGWDMWLEHKAGATGFFGISEQPNGPRQLPPDLAESIRIEAGIPRWGYELREDTLPPEAGLDGTHVDYAKGCYIGQEVISRIKSVGHVNRRLTGFLSTGGEPLQAGWSVFAPGDSVKPIGELTSAAWSFALAKPVALGYLRRGSPSGALLARPAEGGPPPVEVTPAELPLAVHFQS